jgi:hypothetical protein
MIAMTTRTINVKPMSPSLLSDPRGPSTSAAIAIGEVIVRPKPARLVRR